MFAKRNFAPLTPEGGYVPLNPESSKTFSTVKTYNGDDDGEVCAFFDEYMQIGRDEAMRHRETRRAIQNRFYVAALDHSRRRVVIAIGLDGRDPKTLTATAASLTDAVESARQLAKFSRLQMAQLSPSSLYSLHIVGLFWNVVDEHRYAATPPAALRLQLATFAPITFELFAANELVFDVVEHAKQPRRISIAQPRTADQLSYLLANYASLRRIVHRDPVWRRLGVESGTILEYERTDARNGSSIVYRLDAEWNESHVGARERECARLRAYFDQFSRSQSIK